MNLQFYIEKLHASEEYQKFMKENPDAYLCGGFFSIDRAGRDNKQHFDFFVPSAVFADNSRSLETRDINNKKAVNKKTSFSDINSISSTNKASAIEANGNKKSDSDDKGKMFSFQLEDMRLCPLEFFGEAPEKLSFELDFNFDEIEKLIEEKMLKENIKNKMQKMLISLQCKQGKSFLIWTVFISNLGMLKVVIDLEKNEIIDFEKKSFFDILKVVKRK